SIGTDLDSSLRTDLDRSIGTDLDSSLRTDLDQFRWNRSSQFFENRSRRLLRNRSSQFCKNRSKRLLRNRSSLFSSNQSNKALRCTGNLHAGILGHRLCSSTLHQIQIGQQKAHQEILEFLRFLRHSAQIKALTDININKLFQPWRSFGAVINKCLTGKSFGFDGFRLSKAQILWGLYHSRNIDYSFLIWEDFMYQVEHKNQKKSNEMYNLRFTKVIIHHFMSKDLSIPRRNKVNWHYVRDDILFSTIKVVSRHQNTQQYGAVLPIELTNEDIRNTKAYKEYYAYASREAAPKPKDSARRKKSGSDSSTTPPTVVASPRPTIAVTPRLTAAAKGKQPTKAKNEGTGFKPGVPDVPSGDSEEEISWNSSNYEETDTQEQDRHEDEGDEKDESNEGEEDDDDEEEIAKTDVHDDTERGGDDDEESENYEESDDEETREEESFDPIPKTPEDNEDDGNDEEDQDELYQDFDINQGRG
nr:hypothetical protein [Tanacetum cinerariifolium]